MSVLLGFMDSIGGPKLYQLTSESDLNAMYTIPDANSCPFNLFIPKVSGWG